jgi:hypothetical protein
MPAASRDQQIPRSQEVFISYSRKDKEFVHRLDEELKRRDREAWVDWEGIPPGDTWEKTIYGAIESTHTFIFVLTPDSIASEVCGKEIAHAAANNKRLVPIVHRDVVAERVPKSLGELNWIFCRESDDFGEATDTLIRALDTDLKWVRAHTRLLTRAIEWDSNGRNNSFVLRGEDLRSAERWLAEAGAQKERQPTALQTEYIIASRKASARRQRITLGAVTFGLLVATVLATVAFFAEGKAKKQTVAANKALTRTFVRTIGVSDDKAPPSFDERAALWELAELEPLNARVREMVIDDWLRSWDSLGRATRRNGLGLQAAIGLNIRNRNHSSAKLHDVMHELTRTVDDPNPTSNNTDVSRWGEVLSTLENWMEPNDVAASAKNLLPVLLKTLGTRGDREPLGPRGNPERLSRLSEALEALAARTEPKEATALADYLVTELENTQKSTARRLRLLVDPLPVLAPRIEPKDAATLANRLIEVMENPPDSNASRMWSCGRALNVVAKRTDPEMAATVAHRGAQVLANVLEEENEGDLVLLLSGTLAALAAQTQSRDAATLSHLGAQALLRSWESTKADSFTFSGVTVLRSLAARMDSTGVVDIADHLAQALENPQTINDRLLGEALTVLAAREAPEGAARVADRLAQAIENRRVTDPERLICLSKALAAWAAFLDPDEAAKVSARGSQRLANVLDNLQARKENAGQLSGISEAVAALAERMEPIGAENLAARCSQVLVNALDDPMRLQENGNALVALAARMKPASVIGVGHSLVDALESIQPASHLHRGKPDTDANVTRLSNLSHTLAAMAVWMEPQSAQSLVSRGTEIVISALELPPESSDRYRPFNLSRLGDALTALAARLNPQQASASIARGALVLAKELENPLVTEANERITLGWSLGGLSRVIPHAPKTQLLALSEMLTDKFKISLDEPKKQLADLCALLGTQDLAEVLKWPFCMGEARQIVLAEMEKKTGHKFGGDVWKFVEQAPALGIKDIEGPAKHPRLEDALTELRALAGVVPAKPTGSAK